MNSSLKKLNMIVGDRHSALCVVEAGYDAILRIDELERSS